MPVVPDIAIWKRPVATVVPLNGWAIDTTEIAALSVKG